MGEAKLNTARFTSKAMIYIVVFVAVFSVALQAKASPFDCQNLGFVLCQTDESTNNGSVPHTTFFGDRFKSTYTGNVQAGEVIIQTDSFPTVGLYLFQLAFKVSGSLDTFYSGVVQVRGHQGKATVKASFPDAPYIASGSYIFFGITNSDNSASSPAIYGSSNDIADSCLSSFDPATDYFTCEPSPARELYYGLYGSLNGHYTGTDHFSPTASDSALSLSGASDFCNSVIPYDDSTIIKATITFLPNGLCKVMGFLFIPSTQALDNFQYAIGIIPSKFPFNYLTAFSSVVFNIYSDSNISSSSAPPKITLHVWEPVEGATKSLTVLDFGAISSTGSASYAWPAVMVFRTFMEVGLWIIFALGAFYNIRKMLKRA